ncbi:MAG: undecaprenyl diphosphate synthase family protein [Lachnospiraceae bacterium]|nr:undecaprenyl diphosphate synthase family protein [Lachnospiraceae bacterium]
MSMSKHKPEHIGIIPDGNRRWAEGQGMSKKDGYEHGLMPGLKLLQMAKEHGIKEITYYGFTVDNCKRPKEQFQAFQKACVDAVEMLKKEGVELLVMGDSNSKCFPKELLPYTTRISVHGGGIKVNFLVNYGWQWDLSRMQEDGKPYSEDISRIDLIIRWGGMCRLSGFLPIQSVYADFYVEDHLWPDYTDEDFTKALEWYSKQDVTLGG